MMNIYEESTINFWIWELPVLCVLQYQYYQYCWMKNTGASDIVNRSTILVFQYCEYYNTGNTSIVNITILVIPVSRPAASYYPKGCGCKGTRQTIQRYNRTQTNVSNTCELQNELEVRDGPCFSSETLNSKTILTTKESNSGQWL